MPDVRVGGPIDMPNVTPIDMPDVAAPIDFPATAPIDMPDIANPVTAYTTT